MAKLKKIYEKAIYETWKSYLFRKNFLGPVGNCETPPKKFPDI